MFSSSNDDDLIFKLATDDQFLEAIVAGINFVFPFLAYLFNGSGGINSVPEIMKIPIPFSHPGISEMFADGDLACLYIYGQHQFITIKYMLIHYIIRLLLCL